MRLRVSERRALLIAVDLVIVCGALIAAILLRTDWVRGFDPLFYFVANGKWLVTLALIWYIAATLLESYDPARTASGPHSILSATAAAGLTVLVYYLTPWLTPPLASRGLIYVFAALAVAGISAWRGLYAVLLAHPRSYQRALVLGTGPAARALVEALAAHSSSADPFRGLGYLVVGFLDDAPNGQDQSVAGVPVLGRSEDLPSLASQLQASEVVVADDSLPYLPRETVELLIACRERGIRVTTALSVYEELLGRVAVDHAGDGLSQLLLSGKEASGRFFWAVKRIGDCLLSSVALVPLAALMPVVALGNALFSPGPLFFQQPRVGHRGRVFRILKFRTMVNDAEDTTGAVWCAEGDPRITPMGRWLRRTHLDELPQLINVLRGEMSLIGPRPERPEFVEILAKEFPLYKLRHAVPPGITGWAQVRFGYGSSPEDARTKLEYDLYYVKRASFYLDALILLKTLAAVLKLQGR